MFISFILCLNTANNTPYCDSVLYDFYKFCIARIFLFWNFMFLYGNIANVTQLSHTGTLSFWFRCILVKSGYKRYHIVLSYIYNIFTLFTCCIYLVLFDFQLFGEHGRPKLLHWKESNTSTSHNREWSIVSRRTFYTSNVCYRIATRALHESWLSSLGDSSLKSLFFSGAESRVKSLVISLKSEFRESLPKFLESCLESL